MGSGPIRRETDEQAAKRAELIEERRAEWLEGARPLTKIEAKLLRPRIDSSGHLRRGNS